jgi:hypothetical protein
MKALHNYGTIGISGEDAAKFLQGQLTCDITKLASAKSNLAAHLNAQGRIVSLFYICHADQTYYLLMPQDLIPVALKELKKYAKFSKVTLTNLSTKLTCVTLNAQEKALARARVLGERYVGLIAKNGELAEDETWHRENLQQKIPAIYAESSGKLLPHEIGLTHLEAVCFDKGCYTGQEIVSRMEYRTKFRKKICLAEFDYNDFIRATDIYHKKGNVFTACGQLIDAAQMNDTVHLALVFLKKPNVIDNLYIETTMDDVTLTVLA